MTDRSEHNAAIVRQLEIEANVSAAAYVAELEEFQRLYRLERMQDIVFDLTEWIDESGDKSRLADLDVSIDETDAELVFKQGARSMVIEPRDDMSICVNGKIVSPNADCPVLDKPFYDVIMGCVFEWADPEAKSKANRYIV